MSWFKIDDGFHCHPKVFAAGTPAVGLYVRCGSWAAQQASEGIIPKLVARLYGTPRMIKALIDADLWHAAGHDCESCPELDANSYVIHQYLERNPSRVEVESARKLKSARQQKWRENKKNAQTKAGEPSDVDADVDASTREHGDTAPNPTRPAPSPVPPTEVQLASTDAPERLPTIGPKPRIPANCRPLVDALTANRMAVGWNIPASDWLLIEALIKRCGIDMLVDHASGQWQRARQRPQHGTYFIPGWRDLPDLVAADPESLQPATQSGPPTANQRRRDLFDTAAAKLAGGFQ